MILDGAGYHRSKEVIEAAKELGIRLHHLHTARIRIQLSDYRR